jgi:hypothetical protein
MKRWAAFVLALAAVMLLATGCSGVRQSTLMGNHVHLSYAGTARDGSHQYVSDVGDLVWQRGKAITLNAEPFASISGRTGTFTFPDGRVIRGTADAGGELKEVTVATGTEVRADDYPMMQAAMLIYQVESAMIRQRNTALGVSIAIALVLACAAFFAAKPFVLWRQSKAKLSEAQGKKVVAIARLVGIGLVALAVILIIIAAI